MPALDLVAKVLHTVADKLHKREERVEEPIEEAVEEHAEEAVSVSELEDEEVMSEDENIPLSRQVRTFESSICPQLIVIRHPRRRVASLLTSSVKPVSKELLLLLSDFAARLTRRLALGAGSVRQ